MTFLKFVSWQADNKLQLWHMGLEEFFFLLEQHFEDSMCDGYLPCICLVEFLLIVFLDVLVIV